MASSPLASMQLVSKLIAHITPVLNQTLDLCGFAWMRLSNVLEDFDLGRDQNARTRSGFDTSRNHSTIVVQRISAEHDAAIGFFGGHRAKMNRVADLVNGGAHG